MSLKDEIVQKVSELGALVAQIVEPVDPNQQIAELQAQVADLTNQLAVKNDEIVVLKAKLAEVDQAVKAVDALIEDPA
jgi:uncharacterized protein involved in exopolysaccharide biosynthesis